MPVQFKNLYWLSLSAFIIVLDQLTKYWISHTLVGGQTWSVFPSFNLILSHNFGAAFSFLANAGGWQLIFLSSISVTVVMVLSWWLIKLPAHSKLAALAIALIIGGALGNLWDRVHWGYVIDFLDFYYGDWHYATFNLADSAICVGATLLVFSNRHHRKIN